MTTLDTLGEMPCSNGQLIVTVDRSVVREAIDAGRRIYPAPMFNLKPDDTRSASVAHEPIWAGAYRCLPRDLDDPEVSVR
jgi:hypothetical protein